MLIPLLSTSGGPSVLQSGSSMGKLAVSKSSFPLSARDPVSGWRGLGGGVKCRLEGPFLVNLSSPRFLLPKRFQESDL